MKNAWARLAAMAASVLAAAVIHASPAAASRITINPGGAFTASGNLTISGGIMECAGTLSGRITDTSITVGMSPLPSAYSISTNAIGTATGLSISSCTGLASSASALGLPWTIGGRVSIDLTAGTVVTVVTLRGMEIAAHDVPLAGTCLYAGDVPATLSARGDALRVAAAVLARVSGNAFCPGAAQLDGSLALSPAQTVTVTL